MTRFTFLSLFDQHHVRPPEFSPLNHTPLSQVSWILTQVLVSFSCSFFFFPINTWIVPRYFHLNVNVNSWLPPQTTSLHVPYLTKGRSPPSRLSPKPGVFTYPAFALARHTPPVSTSCYLLSSICLGSVPPSPSPWLPFQGKAKSKSTQVSVTSSMNPSPT